MNAKMKELPKRIWLLDMGDEVCWCDSPEPDYDEYSAVEYMRVDKPKRKKP